MKMIFGLQINIKDFFKLIPYYFRLVWPGMPKLPKITSLLFPCNILCFLHADKRGSFLQIDVMIFDGYGQALPKSWKEQVQVCNLQQIQVCSFQLYNISKMMKLGMKLIFCMQINTKVSYKLISTLWTSRYH